MTDFPRGWTQVALVTGGGTATVTVAGAVGVVHVIDSITATAWPTAALAAASINGVQISSSDGVFSGFQPIVLSIMNGAAAGESASGSATGLDLAAGPGASLTISLFTPANTQAMLLVQGHPV